MTHKTYTPGTLPAIEPRYREIALAGGRVERPDVIVRLSVAKRPWGRLETTPRQKWDAVFDGRPLLSRTADPEHACCRALKALGVTGKAAFVHADGSVGMVMDIERAADLATEEHDRGIRIRKYVPFQGFEEAADALAE